MTNEERIQRAEEAKMVLNNPLVVEALEALEQATLARLKAAQDDKDRLRLLDFMHAAGLFKQYFIEHVQTGKMAQAELSEQETFMGRLKRVF